MVRGKPYLYLLLAASLGPAQLSCNPALTKPDPAGHYRKINEQVTEGNWTSLVKGRFLVGMVQAYGIVTEQLQHVHPHRLADIVTDLLRKKEDNVYHVPSFQRRATATELFPQGLTPYILADALSQATALNYLELPDEPDLLFARALDADTLYQQHFAHQCSSLADRIAQARTDKISVAAFDPILLRIAFSDRYVASAKTLALTPAERQGFARSFSAAGIRELYNSILIGRLISVAGEQNLQNVGYYRVRSGDAMGSLKKYPLAVD